MIISTFVFGIWFLVSYLSSSKFQRENSRGNLFTSWWNNEFVTNIRKLSPTKNTENFRLSPKSLSQIEKYIYCRISLLKEYKQPRWQMRTMIHFIPFCSSGSMILCRGHGKSNLDGQHSDSFGSKTLSLKFHRFIIVYSKGFKKTNHLIHFSLRVAV